MTPFFVLLSIVLAGLLAGAIYFYLKAREDIESLNADLDRFEGIRNLEEYKDRQKQQLDDAKREQLDAGHDLEELLAAGSN